MLFNRHPDELSIVPDTEIVALVSGNQLMGGFDWNHSQLMVFREWGYTLSDSHTEAQHFPAY